MFNKRSATLRLAVGAVIGTATFAGPGIASAQTLPRSYIASPDIYSIVARDKQNILVLGVIKPGQRTESHSVPARLWYWLTDCEFTVTTANGEKTEWKVRTGDAGSSTALVSRIVENTGKSECRGLSFEPW